MGKTFLGVDVGSSKTHALVVDETGRMIGFGRSGPGNHEGVGNDGFFAAVHTAVDESLSNSGISVGDLSGAGFGISGYDWPSERNLFMDLLKGLDLACPYDIVNDTCLGLLAGTSNGWGVAVVAGTGCNCWGWTKGRSQVGHVTGSGMWMGEGAGASELVERAVQMVAFQWAKRGPETKLTKLFIKLTGAKNSDDLLEGLTTGYYDLDSSAAPLVFECAQSGDQVAQDLITWAGTELGELAKCVIRQLGFEQRTVEVVLIGSMYDSGEVLIRPMRENILSLAPGAKLIRLAAPPVIGAAILSMETAGLEPDTEIKQRMMDSVAGLA